MVLEFVSARGGECGGLSLAEPYPRQHSAGSHQTLAKMSLAGRGGAGVGIFSVFLGKINYM